ncbi:MAG: hypothetical protein RL839_09080 [Gammaproteobacteria bacterium]
MDQAKSNSSLLTVIITGIVTIVTAYVSGMGGVNNQLVSSMDAIEEFEARVEQSLPHVQPVTFGSSFQVLEINEEDESRNNYWLVRAFIETGNDDPNVLATLRDNNGLGSNLVTLWASARTIGEQKGILLTVVTTREAYEEITIPNDYHIVVNVFQHGTQKEDYGIPVRYGGT